MSNPTLVKNFVASGAIAAHRCVKISASNMVAQASAASDALIGICENLAAADGERVDVVLSGIAQAQAGGSITIGDYLTCDSNGKVVTATRGAAFDAGEFPTLIDGALTGGELPSIASGGGNHLIGIALAGASSGDIIPIIIDRA